MKKVLSIIKSVATMSAKTTGNSASSYYTYQAKEPKNISKFMKK